MENGITLGELIGLLLLFCPPPPPLYFVFENSKNTRIELSRPEMGTIFLVLLYLLLFGRPKFIQLHGLFSCNVQACLLNVSEDIGHSCPCYFTQGRIR